MGKSKTMPTSATTMALHRLLADLRPDGDGGTDGELLTRFVRSRDEDALAALVRRHASMVWGVCRRLLRNPHDAEDAFQATFLVLVRKASAVPREAVANWLYGVARQTAVRVRTTATKRGLRETQVVDMPELTVPEVRDAELQGVVDEELSRLPDHYRSVIVLCDLEDMTRKEAARQLGIPEGSVASRLARARALLARRLNQRGVVFSGSVATVFSAGSGSASAPPAMVASTIRAVSLLAAGQAAGVITSQVAVLTDGVVNTMFVTKIKSVLAMALMLCFLATGATLLHGQTVAGQNDKKPTEKPKEPIPKQGKEKVKDTVTAWGKEAGGLQAGIRLKATDIENATNQSDAMQSVGSIQQGADIGFAVVVRNVSKQEVKLNYIQPSDWMCFEGERNLKFEPGYAIEGKPIRHEKTLQPGEDCEVGQLNITTRKQTTTESLTGVRLVELGKFKVSCPKVLESKLATGEFEIEITSSDGQDDKKVNKDDRR